MNNNFEPIVIMKMLFLTQPALNITLDKIDIWQVRYHYSSDCVTIVWSLCRHQQLIVIPYVV